MMTHELARQTDVLQKLGELPEQQGKSQPVRQVMAYVEEHYPEKITIGRMGEQFHYSETLLIRRFKSETGINFSEYLTHFRLQKAIAMMRESDMSISQIAEACGFRNTAISVWFFRRRSAAPRPSIRRKCALCETTGTSV